MDHSDDFKSVGSMDELRELLQKKTEEHNNTPREKLGGLSPNQARKLLYTDWQDPSCPLRLNDSLPSEAVNQTEIMQNARLLINYIQEREPLPATGTGNVKRKDVKELMEEMEFLREEYLEDVYEMNKVINEQDVVPLHTLKTVMEIGGLLNIRNNKMRIPERTEELVTEERFSELFAELFRVYFREYNIAYFTRGPELEEIQDTIEITLFKLHQLDDDWYADDALTAEVAHPIVLEQYPEAALEEVKNPLPLVYSQRVFKPLSRFGLLERRKIHRNGKEISTRQYRKTPLIDRFLSFQF